MSGNTDRLEQLERYAANDEIAGVLPQTHRMLPVEDVRALVEIAKAARVFHDKKWKPGDSSIEAYNLRVALAALDGERAP